MLSEENRIILTTEEFNLLGYITAETKTDCWFTLDKDDDGFDCVYDLENNCRITLQSAVNQLNEAIIPGLLYVSSDDVCIYGKLLDKLGVKYNPFN